MATFLMLSTVGPDGAATLTENPDRLKAVNAEVEAMGVRVVAQWALLGQYDFCTVLDAPDETTMARVALVLGSRGTLKTLTLSAIPIDDYVDGVLKAGEGLRPQCHQKPWRVRSRRTSSREKSSPRMLPSDMRRMRYPSRGDLGHLEAAHPRALVAVAHVHLGPRRERGPCIRVHARPPRRCSRPHGMRRDAVPAS